MTVNEFLKSTIKDQYIGECVFFRRPRPRVVCVDGYSVKIEAHSGAFCTPKENDLEAYKEVELGFPNQEDPDIAQYIQVIFNRKDIVYGYVPVEIVDQLLEKHGGIDHIERK